LTTFTQKATTIGVTI